MKNKTPAKRAVVVRPRVYLGDSVAIGPGKIDLLQQVAVTRSIAAAARALGIPYKRAWLLLDSLNKGFGRPVVEGATGGKGGGGATVTPLGLDLLSRYRALEERINTSSSAELRALSKLIR